MPNYTAEEQHRPLETNKPSKQTEANNKSGATIARLHQIQISESHTKQPVGVLTLRSRRMND